MNDDENLTKAQPEKNNVVRLRQTRRRPLTIFELSACMMGSVSGHLITVVEDLRPEQEITMRDVLEMLKEIGFEEACEKLLSKNWKVGQ